ncbi:hypothetical protein AB0C29_12275 [Actinoplanes sp. NPDC048791]|uniref:hypothetical protein n=1 Tax=Actinoplanes sp. NPDC048791 TaxID=3154623 RepID=UPI0033D1B852
MTATTHTTSDIARRARELDQTAQAARSNVALQQIAAEQMAAEARAAAEAVLAGEAAARAEASRAYTSEMLRLSGEVQAARAAAVQAVHDSGDVLTAWLAYRSIRAVNSGRWEALKAEYLRVVGSTPPPGNWGPRVAPGRIGEADAGVYEDFASFLSTACDEHERTTQYASFAETSNELANAAREAAE